MAESRLVGFRTERGTHSVVGQSIAAASTYTVQVPLGRADYRFGVAVLVVPNSVAALPGRAMFVMFTDASANGVAQSHTRDSTTIFGYENRPYTFTNWSTKGYYKGVDPALSDAYFDTFGSYIRLNSAIINGSNLEFEFYNAGPGARTLTINISYRSIRTPP